MSAWPPPAKPLSWAWMSVADVDIAEDNPHHQPPSATAALADHPARARLMSVIAAALKELQPPEGVLTVAVAPPSPGQIEQARVMLEQRSVTLPELTARVGDPGDPPAAWGAEWTVLMLSGGVISTWRPFLAATDLPQLLVEVADLLQDCLTDQGITDPYPPCAGHAHALRPVVLDDGTAWWQCPRGSAIRPFADVGLGTRTGSAD